MSDAIQTIGIRFQFGGQLCLEGWARAGVSITPFWRFNPLEWVMHGWHIGHDPGPRSFCSVPLYSYLLSSLCVTFSPQKESHTKERRSVGFNAPSKLQSGPAGLYTSFCWHKNKSSVTVQTPFTLKGNSQFDVNKSYESTWAGHPISVPAQLHQNYLRMWPNAYSFFTWNFQAQWGTACRGGEADWPGRLGR